MSENRWKCPPSVAMRAIFGSIEVFTLVWLGIAAAAGNGAAVAIAAVMAFAFNPFAMWMIATMHWSDMEKAHAPDQRHYRNIKYITWAILAVILFWPFHGGDKD